MHQALLETLRLGYAAEGGDLASLQGRDLEPLSGKHIFEVKRVMNAFDNARARVELRNQTP